MQKSLFIVLTGAGGVGKTTIRDGLVAALPSKLTTVQKVTTRDRRPGEGSEFRFVRDEEFAGMERRGELFAPTSFGGHHYATERRLIDAAFASGKSIIMVLDADGGRMVRQEYPRQTLWIYLTAPETELRQRLAARGETPERINERMRLAPVAETPEDGETDLVVVNSDGRKDQAITEIVKAIQTRLG